MFPSFPRRGARRAALGCLLALALAPAGRAAAPAAGDGWQLLSGYLFRDAYDAFRQAPADRMTMVGEVAGLLNHSPVTAGKVARGEAQLRQLLAENGTDEAATVARYLLARIAHLHRPGEVPEIEAAYRAVLTAAPDHPLAQAAAGKLALVFLYQRPDLAVPERLAAAAALEPQAAAAALPEAACAYYRALANAALYYGVLDEQVLHWLARADEIGTLDVMNASALRIQLAETARALGRREAAVGYYRKFLASVLPTDNRYRTAQERMQELEAAP